MASVLLLNPEPHQAFITRRSSTAHYVCSTVCKLRLCGFASQKYSSTLHLQTAAELGVIEHNHLTIIVIVSELISLYILFLIWSASGRLALKVFLSIVALVPVIGPIFYWASAPPSIQRRHLKDKPSDISHLGGYGRYSDWWLEEKPKMEKRIREAEAKNRLIEEEKSQ